MKFLIAVLLLITSTCVAQHDSASLSFHKKLVNIVPDKSQTGLINIPFKDVKILDVRADTTSIGFLKRSPALILQVDFTKGLTNELSTFSKNTYHFNLEDSNTLVVLIKNFRVSNFATVAEVDNNNLAKWNSGILLNAELFSFNSKGYHALYKMDTVFISKRKFLIENIPAAIFHLLFCKVENKNFSDLHVGKTEFSFQQLQEHINIFYNFPILTDSELKKGVYKTFDEFKNNKPSIENFQTNNGKLSDELYVIENNQAYVLQGYWGYCDGKNLYIHSADNNFKLYRIGNTFNTKGFKFVDKQQYSMALTAVDAAAQILSHSPFIIISPQKAPDKYEANNEVFQLNMLTGEMY